MKPKAIIKSLRSLRKYHRGCGLAVALLLFISAVTGIFLAWKKDIALIQPPTQKGESKELADWKPIHELALLSKSHFDQTYPELSDYEIDRIDVRPSKGIAKVLLNSGWWEIQIDGKTGAILSTERRHSDWIEQLHDGSIISDFFKLCSMNFLGIGVLFMIFSGLWLWYGPKQFRSLRRK